MNATIPEFAYVAVIDSRIEAFIVAKADPDGGYRVPVIVSVFDEYDDARVEADRRNREELGLTWEQAYAMIVASMFRPGEYLAILNDLETSPAKEKTP
jgi:hypothetical protein